MKQPLDERELIVLESIRDSSEPLGSWSLVEHLEERGYRVSSASIGRILYRLEQRGLVEGQGNRGRIITKTGIAIIGKTKAFNSMDAHRRDLENLINSKVLEDFIMVLQARKAIERETVRLAAENITEAGKKSLSAVLEEQEIKAKRGESIAEIDIAFHRGIATASRQLGPAGAIRDSFHDGPAVRALRIRSQPRNSDLPSGSPVHPRGHLRPRSGRGGEMHHTAHGRPRGGRDEVLGHVPGLIQVPMPGQTREEPSNGR